MGQQLRFLGFVLLFVFIIELIPYIPGSGMKKSAFELGFFVVSSINWAVIAAISYFIVRKHKKITWQIVTLSAACASVLRFLKTLWIFRVKAPPPPGVEITFFEHFYMSKYAAAAIVLSWLILLLFDSIQKDFKNRKVTQHSRSQSAPRDRIDL